MMHSWWYLILLGSLPWQCLSDASNRGTFENPDAATRAFFRYWFPDASVDPDLVAADIASAGEIGAGGVEFLPFYNYGGWTASYPKGADWGTYAFGTAPFLNIFRRALEAHAENDMVMDFSIGPNQGQGVPAQSDDEGLQWDLVPFAAPCTANGTAKVPGWGSGELVALVTGLATDLKNTTAVPPVLDLTVRESSLKVATKLVTEAGVLQAAACPTVPSSETWIFAFYQRRTLIKNVLFPFRDQNEMFQNGSYTVDHFSERGARTMIDFWEKHILGDGIDKLLASVGNYGWEDSMEIFSNMSWTPGLPQRFLTDHGYEIYRFLPVLMWGNNNLVMQTSNPGKVRVKLDTADGGIGYINVYRETLQHCYTDYLSTLSSWIHSRLGLAMSAQPAYNLPMDTLSSVPFVDVPECESLGWEDNIDGYRKFTGPAALTSQRIVSNEMGATMKPFHLAIPNLLASVNRAFAGGVNRMVLHGQAYAHNYYETTWPGYTPWQYIISEPFSEKFPMWRHGLEEALEYIARSQHVLQSGVQRVDLALYYKASASEFTTNSIDNGTDLLDSGYSYAYLSPDNFQLSSAVVDQGRLAPDSAAFKALVIMTADGNLTLEGTRKIIEFAEQGLPILIEGQPGYYPMDDGSDVPALTELLEILYSLPGVHRYSEGGLLVALNAANVAPRVTTRVNSTVHTVWREDADNDIEYLFIFTDGDPASGTVEIDIHGRKPYVMDAWTGAVTALLHYSVTEYSKRIIIPLDLASGQAVIYGFAGRDLPGVDVAPFSISKLPAAVLGCNYSHSKGLVLNLGTESHAGNSTLILSAGNHTSSVPVVGGNVSQPIFELNAWTLVAEHWEAPENISDGETIAVKRNTTHDLVAPLRGWTELGPELVNASGIGYYSTSFDWGLDSSQHGAYLEFLSPALNYLRVFVNGERLPPVDPTRPVVDVSSALRAGRNEILVVVPATMWNYIRSVRSKLISSGLKAGPYAEDGGGSTFGGPYPLPPPSENGLLGNVVVRPFGYVHVPIERHRL